MGSCSRASSISVGVDNIEVKEKRNKGLRKEYVNETGRLTSQVITELGKYLGSDCEDNDDHGCHILSWWLRQGKIYSILMSMPNDVLAIPVSSVASVSYFSMKGRTHDHYHTSLSPRMVEALVCCQEWICISHEPICLEKSLLKLENLEAR